MKQENIKDELESLQRKDRLNDADKSRMADLRHQLERWTWDRKEEEEKLKNIYFEMALQVSRLIKPNGRWRSGDTKRWSELRDEVVDFILKRKIKEEGNE